MMRIGDRPFWEVGVGGPHTRLIMRAAETKEILKVEDQIERLETLISSLAQAKSDKVDHYVCLLDELDDYLNTLLTTRTSFYTPKNVNQR